MSRRCLIALALALAVLPAAPARAANAIVQTCDEAGLLAAIEATASDGTVSFDCGAPATITLTSTIQVRTTPGSPNPTNLTIQGDGLITISGGGAVRPFAVGPAATLTLDGLTIAGGFRSGESGGAVLNEGTLDVTGVVFVDNRADSGGAIYNEGVAHVSGSVFYRNRAAIDGGAVAVAGGTFSLDDGRLEGNSAGGSGGGIFNAGQLAVQGTRIQGNSAASGGGLHSVAGAVTLRDSELSGNRAGADGGGVRNEADLALIGSTVAGNSAGGSAGGVANNAGALALTNSTVSGNQASGNGGGIASYGGLRLTAATVAANRASGTGGGIFSGAGTAVLTSTLLAGNSATLGLDCAGAIMSGGYNLLQRDAGCGFASDPSDLVNQDPLLGPLADNGGPSRTHALLPGSPAVDVVIATDQLRCQIRDQRGVNRPVGLGCDIGAFELGFVVNSLADAPAFNPTIGVCATSTAGECTLRAAIQHANALFGKQAITFAVTGTITLSPDSVDPMRVDIEPDQIADLDIREDAIIIGRGAGQTIVDGAGDPEIGGVLHIAPGVTATIVGVMFRGGNAGANRFGGGVRNEGQLALMDSVVSSNSADRGGGIANTGTLALIRTTVSGNSAGSGGGGIDSGTGAHLAIAESTISGNAATGLFAIGGGISSAGRATLTNVTLSDNSAAQDGGGIAVLSGGADAVRLNNVTVAGNTADADANNSGNAGGIYVQNGSGDVTLMNSLLAGNQDRTPAGFAAQIRPDCAGSFTSLGYNLVGVVGTGGDDTCVAGAGPGDQLGSASRPLVAGLGPLANNGGPTRTRALLTGSPALNAGSPASPGGQGNACLAADQRGAGRPVGARCDIGASEAFLADLSVQQGVAGRALVGGELAYSIVVANAGPSATGGVTLTETLPPGALLLRAFPSQGACSVAPQGVSCALGTLASGASATVQVAVLLEKQGAAVSTARVAGTEADPAPGNNAGSAQVMVEFGLFLPVARR
jgi:CSLREA domain-containing protein/uncharacterized repeat protein (TIGR01451 family)